MITDVNKVIIKNFWNDFASGYKLGIITAFFLLILVAATASVYPYLIQLVFDGLLAVSYTHLTLPTTTSV